MLLVRVVLNDTVTMTLGTVYLTDTVFGCHYPASGHLLFFLAGGQAIDH